MIMPNTLGAQVRGWSGINSSCSYSAPSDKGVGECAPGKTARKWLEVETISWWARVTDSSVVRFELEEGKNLKRQKRATNEIEVPNAADPEVSSGQRPHLLAHRTDAGAGGTCGYIRKNGVFLIPYPEAELVFSPESIMPLTPIERSLRAEGA